MSERARYWAGMVEAWERSGLSQAEFCRRRGLKAVTLSWWKRQLPQVSGDVSGRQSRPGENSRRFVEVRLPGASVLPGYEVVLGGGRSIRVPAHFDDETVSRLIALVESC